MSCATTSAPTGRAERATAVATIARVRAFASLIACAAVGGCGGHTSGGQSSTGGPAGASGTTGSGGGGVGGAVGVGGGVGGTLAVTGGAGIGGAAGAGGTAGVATGGGGSVGAGAAGAGAGGDGASPAGSGGDGRAGAGGAGLGADLTGGVDWEPWPAVDAVPANTCAVLQVSGGDRSSSPQLVNSETWEYDATTRILTRRHAAVGSVPAWNGYVRFDAQGRREMICHAQDYFTCLEWVRDSLGNAKSYSYYGVADGPLDARTLDPAHPPTKSAPGNGGGESENDTLTYSAGLLSSAVYYFPQSGARLTYSRDDQGRCSDVLWAIAGTSLVENDHWTFDGDELVSRVVTNVNDPNDVRGVMTYAYDAEGTLAATVVDGRLDFPDSTAPSPRRDGIADYVVRTVKQPDGSRWVETLDFEFTNARNNAHVMRNGQSTAVLRFRWYFSPACEALSLPRHKPKDCEFERPLAMMPLGWHDPLQTPIQSWTMTPLPD
jgi:hypothetical protein